MTADQSPPAFSEMGEEIAKGWESLQEDMQRLIMDSNPTSEPGSPMGGATHDHHDSPRSPVDDGDLLPVSERPAGTTADGNVEGSARDIGEKVGGWFRAFAAEIAGVFDDRVLDDKRRDRGGTASMTAAVGNVDDGHGHGVTSDDAYTRERGGASRADEAGGPVSRGGSKSEDPGGGSTPRVGPGAGFIPLFAESIQGQGDVDGRDGYYTDGDDPFRHLLSSERVQSNGFNRPNAAVDVSAQSTSASALETQRLWGNPGRFVSFEDCAEVLRSLPEADDAMAACDAAVVRFNREYRTSTELSPEDRLASWRRAGCDLCRSLMRALTAAGGRLETCASNQRHGESLVNAVEGYVMGGIQAKVFHGVLNTYAADDAEAARALRAIESLPPNALGLHPSHLHAVDSFATGTIRGLTKMSCPKHMATAICDVVRHLAANCARLKSWREEGAEGGADTAVGTDEPAPAPGTDDLLSLLVVLLAKCGLASPVSLAMYADSFHVLLGSQHSGEIGYALANFYGAVQYARSEPMRDLLIEWGIALDEQ